MLRSHHYLLWRSAAIMLLTHSDSFSMQIGGDWSSEILINSEVPGLLQTAIFLALIRQEEVLLSPFHRERLEVVLMAVHSALVSDWGTDSAFHFQLLAIPCQPVWYSRGQWLTESHVNTLPLENKNSAPPLLPELESSLCSYISPSAITISLYINK